MDGVTVSFDQAAIDNAMRQIKTHLDERVKDVEQLCAKYAIKVQAEAQRNLAKDPRRIKTGLLRRSIHTRGAGTVWDAYTALEYAAFVHWGTGIHGQNPAGGHRQTPWPFEIDGKTVWTRGMKPNMFMLNAINSLKDDFFRDLFAIFKDD